MDRPLVATYRLQLSARFTLHDARERIAYLRALGISHLYLSPILAARAGSTHGYDVADYSHVSTPLGGKDAFVALAHEAHAAGMGVVLDIVPNHMGTGPDNPFWDDVLAHGRASQYADWFDVAWRAPTKRLTGKILVPILADPLRIVLAHEDLRLERSPRGLRLRYFDHSLPIDPSSAPADVEDADRWTQGKEGQARLKKLLARQHYELAHWRTANRDLNYRRFFDVNELISLRVEREDVFEATHRTVLGFVADGLVDGLRVDHIDGLLEPRRYLERLRQAVEVHVKRTPRFPIFVEKILAGDETLPADWPVDGTTGYEFLVSLEDLFIEPAGAALIERRYHAPRSERSFHDVAVKAKRGVLRGALNADVRRVAPMLDALAGRVGWPELPISAYAGAIVGLIAVLPVYRTYIDAERGEASPADRAVLERALAEVESGGLANPVALQALREALLGSWRDAESHVARARMMFVLRWQQLTGPAAAKGVEDTALYAYAPLASRCEVGGDPGLPVHGADDRFDRRLRERAERFPLSLNATNTHDTKRSADARARIDALSEYPEAWARALSRWGRRHHPLRRVVRGRLVPSRATYDFVHQALIAVWPLSTSRTDGDDWLAALRDRLTEYLRKAEREAKIDTNWTDPDIEYERAVEEFIAALLDPERDDAHLAEVDQFVRRLSSQAMWNALARLAVHLMAPGVPDIYQGDELWYAALVDPDNRRPVDWDARDAAMARVTAVTGNRAQYLAKLRDDGQAGELKLLVLRELLSLRRARPDIIGGGYGRRRVVGQHAEQLFAFERAGAGARAIVLVARYTASLDWPQVGLRWGGTKVVVDGERPATFHRVLHGGCVTAHRGELAAAEIFEAIPMEVLVEAPKDSVLVG